MVFVRLPGFWKLEYECHANGLVLVRPSSGQDHMLPYWIGWITPQNLRDVDWQARLPRVDREGCGPRPRQLASHLEVVSMYKPVGPWSREKVFRDLGMGVVLRKQANQLDQGERSQGRRGTRPKPVKVR